jgi:hypothetical protein
MHDVNLSAPRTNCKFNSLDDLETLVNSADGPLRIKVKGDVPYIGVRSWTTYFFEKIRCAFNLDSVKNIENETFKEIRQFVPAFLKDRLASKDLALPHMLLLKLCTRASEASVEPELGARFLLNASTTRPEYAEPVIVRETTVKVIDGMMPVPGGLSITAREIGTIMADCHLVSDTSTDALHPPAGAASGVDSTYAIPKKVLPTLVSIGKSPGEEEFYNYYYDNLKANNVSIRTCVAIELLCNSDQEPYPLTRSGAWRAATQFMKEREKEHKPVSVVLSVKQDLKTITKTLQPFLPNRHPDMTGQFAGSQIPQGDRESTDKSSDAETSYSDDESDPEIDQSSGRNDAEKNTNTKGRNYDTTPREGDSDIES